MRCSSATNLTIKPEIYDLQKGAGQPCKTFSPPHKRCFTVTNATLKHRHSYPQIFHRMCIKNGSFFFFRDFKKIKFWQISAPSKINWIFLDPRCLGDYDAALSELRIMIFFVLSGVWQIMTRYSGTIYHPFFPIAAPRKLLSPSKGKHSVSRKRFKERTNQNCRKQERLHLQLQCINI